jgi:tetratricopeptide (TPR) repeat protein
MLAATACWLALTGGCLFRSSQDQAIDHYVAGKLALERQEYEKALAELAQAVEKDPTLSSAHAAIADIYRKQGNYEFAASAYEQACQTNPYEFLSHYNLGVVYQLLSSAAKTTEATGEYLAKAVRVYLRAVTLKPGDFDANLNLAACYFQEGKYEQAEHYCKTAISLEPRNAFAYSNLGIIYDAQNRPYEAIRAYKDSLELDVHQPKLLLNLGATYHRLGWYKDAVNAFKLAAREDPLSAYPWEQMGSCYFTQRKWDEALGAYQAALQLDRRSPQAYRGLGVVHMAQYLGDRSNTELRDKGLEAWRRSLELDARQPDLVRLLHKYTPTTTAPEL